MIILDDQFSASVDFPIDYFIPLPSSNGKSPSHSDENLSEIIIDRKANKHFEPPSSTTSNKQIAKPTTINEDLLCSIPCENESDFLSSMQQSNMKISQANLSPPIFLQGTSKSSFAVSYTYCQASSMVNATVKFANLPPSICFNQNQMICLKEFIEIISRKLDEYQIELENEPIKKTLLDVDALRGSLPIPITISQNMLLVKPHSTDKQTALETENLISNHQNQVEQWFDTTKNQYDMFECSICCEVLTSNDAYQLLPCMFQTNSHQNNHFFFF